MTGPPVWCECQTPVWGPPPDPETCSVCGGGIPELQPGTTLRARYDLALATAELRVVVVAAMPRRVRNLADWWIGR